MRVLVGKLPILEDQHFAVIINFARDSKNVVYFYVDLKKRKHL